MMDPAHGVENYLVEALVVMRRTASEPLDFIEIDLLFCADTSQTLEEEEE